MLQHLRNYASAGFLSALVGIFSFPVLTRSLSVEEYGLVGLVSSTMTIVIAIGKFGLQHSVVRYYAPADRNYYEHDLNQLHTTTFTMFFVLALIATGVSLFLGVVVLPDFVQYGELFRLSVMASGIVLIRLVGSSTMNFLRAHQRSAEASIAQGLSKVLNLGMILGFLALARLEPWSVFACLLVAECIAVLYAAYCYRHDFYYSLNSLSPSLAKTMLVYGLPLMILETLGLVLRLSDRYFIEGILGVEALGQYTASYNFASYLELIALAALVQALMPAYMQIWESEGRLHTKVFLSKGLHFYTVIGFPFVTMFALTGPYLLSFLAGDKYQEGTIVIPYVALSFFIEGAIYFLAAGVYIFKNTQVLMLWSLIATVSNLVLNILVIPEFGITGAAIVTVVSQAIFAAGVTAAAFQQLPFRVAQRSTLLIIIASLLVFAMLSPLDFGNVFNNFLIKGLAGTSILLTIMWRVDPFIKEWVAENIK